MAPPAYPRIPYLWPTDSATSGDRVVPFADRAAWLRRPVVVEEKLDGANVCIWWEGNGLQVAGRGGPGAMDRGGQLGPLRARVAEEYEVLRPMLEKGLVVYAEWLWLTHTVEYDRLPDHLVVLDVLLTGAGFAPVHERDELCRLAGLVVPPRLFSGVLRTEYAVAGLLGPSTVGATLMEGIVLRRDDGAVCKVVRPGFVRADDDRIARRRNGLVGP